MLHFDEAEFAARKGRTLAAMGESGIDALLLFKQESMYWLTGYDSFGFCFFQCLVLTAAGDFVLLTRAPDLRQAQLTSILGDIRVWEDREGADPTRELRALLEAKGLSGKRLGIEWEAHGLTAAHGMRLAVQLDGFARMVDASRLVSRLRLVKSAAELAFVRKAGELADAALAAAIAHARPGAEEGVVLARMHDAIFEAGGDYPANPFIIGSGREALLCRYHAGRRQLDAEDQLTLELAGVWRQYHACLMRTLLIGPVHPEHARMLEICREALAACEDRLRPGRTIGEVFAAHAETFDRNGLRAHRLNACGYSLGAVYAPSWMDWPMIYADNPVVLEPGMVFFLHMILANSETGRAMTLGRTAIVTEGAPEILSRLPLEAAVR
ncbi:MAG: Xaa-Pro peptidase family protein [Geminicoccaceae bacterium]|nr:Xaa-Pro peptidase family protein [Geminicoccaceae bacterium]MCX8101458.1 Xaa-Pro peptidase family protein [Geminicoccaceae bacterium]MDW8368702.1 Xaa-Pro peptidase family protein [Geminicoccaceae bacterium]